MALVESVRSNIARHHMLDHGEAVVVAVSGGPDSLCLLHALRSLKAEYALRLHVAHLNHRLRGADSDADAAFVAQLASEWGLACTVEAYDVPALSKARKIAIEEAARQARYLFLARVAASVGARKIAVGHNSDDQVETVLMHLLRGSGLAGLRGMLPVSNLSELHLGEGSSVEIEGSAPVLIRPLLTVRREEIEEYCREQGLQPRFDRSNLDTTYYRNRLRHELLPALETFNPNLREVLLRSCDVISADYDYIRAQSALSWSQVVTAESQQAITFELDAWRKLPLALQRSTMREAILRLRRSLRNIDWVHVDNAIHSAVTGHAGARATLPQGLEVVVNYEELVVADKDHVAALPDLPWMHQVETALRIPGRVRIPDSRWHLEARIVALCDIEDETLRPASPWQAYLDYDVTGKAISLRPRKRGDRFWPQGQGGGPTSVNHFMTNAKVPRAWRDSLPVLASTAHVLWIAGWRIDERVKVTEDTERVLVLTFGKARAR